MCGTGWRTARPVVIVVGGIHYSLEASCRTPPSLGSRYPFCTRCAHRRSSSRAGGVRGITGDTPDQHRMLEAERMIPNGFAGDFAASFRQYAT